MKIRPEKKPPRKRTPLDVETAVLANSARCCVLCCYVKGDLTEKLGQIAHLDEDRTNRKEYNLAWMCLEHHSLYDSKTKQHKNYTIHEVKAARSRLYDLVAQGKHLTPAAAQPYQNEADKKVLRNFMETVPSNGSISFLRTDNFAGFSFEENGWTISTPFSTTAMDRTMNSSTLNWKPCGKSSARAAIRCWQRWRSTRFRQASQTGRRFQMSGKRRTRNASTALSAKFMLPLTLFVAPTTHLSGWPGGSSRFEVGDPMTSFTPLPVVLLAGRATSSAPKALIICPIIKALVRQNNFTFVARR
jgi:hypothetical protein